MPASEKAAGRRAAVKAQNRAMILNAARGVFAQMGYAQATVRDIIHATPLASGTFYNYFKSKEAIFQALGDDAAAAIRPRLAQALAEAPTDRDFLSAAFGLLFELAWAIRADTTRADAPAMRMDGPELAAVTADLSAAFGAAMARGLFAPADADLLATALTGVAFEMAGHPGAPGPAAFVASLFLGGIPAIPKKE